MGKTDGERLKRWRKKQKEGGRRHISFMLSLQATRELEKIQKDTGESAAGVIDRLLTKQGLQISAEAPIDTRQELSKTANVSQELSKTANVSHDTIAAVKTRISPEKQKVLDLIRTLREQHGLSHIQIAKYLNEEGIETFSGKGVHGQGQIGKLLKKMGVK